jgi:hypothetical protein
MNLLRDVVTEYDELPVMEIGGELKPGMKKVFFPAETKRYVHVSRAAIIQNTKHKKNHPTILVVDENGNRLAYHAVILRGPSALKFALDEPGIDANAFLVTMAGIEAYTDLEGDAPVKEVPLTGEEPAAEDRINRTRLFVRWALRLPRRMKLGLWRSAKYVPVARCLLPDPPEE